ncbi:Hypothetical protein FKW44_001833, partial [Caligus rogercresseyi]
MPKLLAKRLASHSSISPWSKGNYSSGCGKYAALDLKIPSVTNGKCSWAADVIRTSLR